MDIVALADDRGVLLDPAPLPLILVDAAREVAVDLALPEDWLNNGPSSGEGGLFRMGLPDGFTARLTWTTIGEKLALRFISRFDPIHFKLYAAVDQPGSYHADDLQELHPTEEDRRRASGRGPLDPDP